MSYSKVDFGGKQTQWAGGAGKGDHERPVNRKVFRETLERMKKHGMRGEVARVNGIKTTLVYK
jgi:hypothetical protein